MRALKTVAEYQAERMRVHKEQLLPKGVGVACPECGEEMVRADDMIYTSFPPQIKARCPKCLKEQFLWA